MNESKNPPGQRVVARSKFLFEGDRKFYLQGVAYGPFRPETPDGPFLPNPEKAERDFKMIAEAGLNTLRLYHSPPRWFLDLAWKYGLRVITTIPWPLRGLFLNDSKVFNQIRKNAREAARANAGHPAVLGFYVDNEMAPDLVRWYGPRKVEEFLNSLITIVKEEDPGALTSYAGYPPTEYLTPWMVDFYSYNVYLHDQEKFGAYLARLQNIAGDKPLVIGEFGMDTIRHSEEEQAALIASHYEEVFRGGLAGTTLFSWTDEWFTGGLDIDNWAFGLVTRDRRPKKSYEVVKQKTLRPGDAVCDKYPIPNAPRVSVVVCSYNGAKTLRGCMEALEKTKYPDFEIVLVDDGSKDNTQEIMKDFPGVMNIKQPNMGLSAARNNGYRAANGEIIAYTDSDCMPDEDWVYHITQTLLKSGFAAVGGPNISPPAADWIQATVAAAPGSPSHVLLSDTEAEHVPGCNMAYHRWALDLVDGFDVIYRKAGDDVDLCWRLMQQGHKIAFSPAAVVWHHRRFTVDAYFGQQKGYGEAEALLRYKHLNLFDKQGNARWKGTIYGAPLTDGFFDQPIVYHGVFALGFFQSIYRRPQSYLAAVVGSLRWIGLTLFILILSTQIPLLRVVPLIMFGATLLAAVYYMSRAQIERKHDGLLSRLLLLYLALVQPWSRAWARYFTWLEGKRTPKTVLNSREEELVEPIGLFNCGELAYWGEKGLGREVLLEKLAARLEKEGWRYVLDNGWGNWDVEILASRWWHVRLRTLSEHYPEEKRLTRVANDLLVNTFSILVLAVLAGIALTVSIYLGKPHYWWPLAAVSVPIIYWISRGLAIRRRIAELIQVSAMDAKLLSIANDADRKGVK
ncbi:MAG: glycosyltransferase [Verrucomicrobiales bacterium]|jgi:glycosyltransferase involved in cell wall biosynthesis|nr:glycosyltransferase [Verrucomicrobiales bacterium]